MSSGQRTSPPDPPVARDSKFGGEFVTEVDWGHRHGVRLEYEAKPVVSHRLVRAEKKA